MAITIYSAHTEDLIKRNEFQNLLLQIPDSLKLRALRYKSSVSAYNFVIGRLLLKYGLRVADLDSDLEQIEYEKNGKPYLAGIHFNISHSGHRIICAFSKAGPIGVDLEKISPIDFKNFRTMFSEKEWSVIYAAPEPLRAFYWFWTRKESIIKVLGRNLNYLHQIELDVTLDYFEEGQKRYYLEEIELGQGYRGALCADEEIGSIIMEELTF